MSASQVALVQTLNDLAQSHIEAGAYEAALPPLQKALKLAGELSLWRAITLTNLGQTYRFLGDNDTALAYTQQSIALCERLEDEDSSRTQAFLMAATSNLASVYRLKERFSEAEAIFKKALAFYSGETGAEVSLGRTHHSLALLYMDMGDYAAAGPHLNDAIESTKSTLGELNLQYVVQISALADWHRHQGDLSAAVRLHERAVEIYGRVYGLEHPNYASNLCSLANLYREMRWNDKAEDALRRVEVILKAKLGERHPIYRDCLNNLSVTLAYAGKYGEAEELARRSLQLVRAAEGSASPSYAAGLHNLIRLLPHMSEGSLTTALVEFLETDELRPTLQDSINQFFALTERGLPAIQLEFLCRIAAIERANGMDNSASYAATLVSLGLTHRSAGDLASAEACFQQSLEVQRRCGAQPRPELALHLNALAEVRAATGKPLDALELMREASTIDTFVMSQAFVTGSEEERARHALGLRENFHVFLSLVLEFLRGTGHAVDSAFDLTLQRKSLGSEALSAQRDAIVSGKYSEVQHLTEWRDLRARIARRTLAGSGAASGEAGPGETLARMIERKEEIERDLARQIPEMGLSQRLKTADRLAVHAALLAGTALIEFVQFAKFDFLASSWTDVHYIAFVLTKDEPATVQMLDLGPREPVDQLIDGFRAAVTGGEGGRHLGAASGRTASMENEIRQQGAELRRLLFDPLLPRLKDAATVFIATDGDLARLPFETLPLDSGGYLIDRYEFSYLNSGRDLLRLGTEGRPAASSSVVFADPDFDFACDGPAVPDGLAVETDAARGLIRGGIRFARLDGTRVEGEKVGELLQVPPALDRQALKGRLRAMASPLVLHIATHGFFLPQQESPHAPPSEPVTRVIFADRETRYFDMAAQNPLLRAGLALAGANRTLAGQRGLPQEAEDGILTAEDVALMDLSGTELVVLSACDTGLGDVTVGEGVYGLQRAVVTSGARTLVMSLWKVPDRQTQELMVEFYQRVLKGDAVARALREAQLVLRERYPNPFNWGAFICQGDPGPLHRNRSLASSRSPASLLK